MTVVLGLTGSIGMGKTTTAAMFAEAGASVHGADEAVHTLYALGGKAVGPVGAAFPGVIRDGAVDRQALAAQVTGDAEALRRLEAIVHPLVTEARDAFVAAARSERAAVVVLDVPLLFETGLSDTVDAVVVASAPSHVQRERVLNRPGMTADKLDALLARQIPDAEKRARADFIVDTGAGLDAAQARVRQILQAVQAPGWRPLRGVAGRSKPPH